MKSFSSVLLLSCLFLFSCGGDPDPVPEVMIPLSEQLIGTYTLFTFEISGCEDITYNISPIMVDSDGCVDADGDFICNVGYTFSEDGIISSTVTRGSNVSSGEGNYTYDDETGLVSIEGGLSDDESIIFDEEGLRFIDDDYDGCQEVYRFMKVM